MLCYATGHPVWRTRVLRVPLRRFIQGDKAKVYSFVAGVPFSPIDIDVGRLARGEWNALTDRFRIWYMPGEDGRADTQLCYLMVRKFDPHDEVVVYAHVMVNLWGRVREGARPSFTVGILSNDDVRARTTMNVMLDIPPVFHNRAELQIMERRWRSDPDAVLRFSANVHSALAQMGRGGRTYEIKIDVPPEFTERLKQNMGVWWQNQNGDGSR